MGSGWLARWVEAERGRFFLLLPIAMGTSILIYFWLPFQPPFWVSGVLVALAGGALLAGWRHAYVRFVALLALAAALGFFRAEWRTVALPPMVAIQSGVSALSGIVSRVEPLPNGARILLRAPRLNDGPVLRRNIRLKLKQGDTLPAPGTMVACDALLFSPPPPPFPGGWQQRRDDYFANRAAEGVAVTDLWILHPAPPDQWGTLLQQARGKITISLLASLPLSTGGVAVTLFTGDEQIIPPAERQAFVLSGLAHILAVAGLHVGIVMGLFFALTRWLLSRSTWVALHWPCKPIAAVIAISAGGGYALLTGAHLPILRSLSMACLVTLGILLGRRAISLRGLAVAAMVLMLSMPEVILSAGFQMSFSAVIALVSGYAALHPIWSHFHLTRQGYGKILVVLVELILTSLLAGGASMPFAAYQFQQITPYWIPANLVAVPLTALWIMPLGLAGLAMIPLHLAWLFFHPMGWGLAAIVWITRHIAAWPGAQIIVPPVSELAILLYAAGLAWLCIWRSRLRVVGVGLMLLGLGVAWRASPPDVLVSADAKLIAIHYDKQVFLLARHKANKFTLMQWHHVWGRESLQPVQCSAEICRLGPVLYASVPVTACWGAKILVSPVAQPGCVGSVVLDATRAAKDGVVAAWITTSGAVRLRSNNAFQGHRPWSVG